MGYPRDVVCKPMTLLVENRLLCRPEKAGGEAVRELGLMVRNSSVPLVPFEEGEHIFFAIADGELDEGLLPHLKELLVAVGQAAPGLLTGYLELWWRHAIDSGPQRLILNEEGKLLIQECTVIWEDPEEYNAAP